MGFFPSSETAWAAKGKKHCCKRQDYLSEIFSCCFVFISKCIETGWGQIVAFDQLGGHAADNVSSVGRVVKGRDLKKIYQHIWHISLLAGCFQRPESRKKRWFADHLGGTEKLISPDWTVTASLFTNRFSSVLLSCLSALAQTVGGISAQQMT